MGVCVTTSRVIQEVIMMRRFGPVGDVSGITALCSIWGWRALAAQADRQQRASAEWLGIPGRRKQLVGGQNLMVGDYQRFLS